MINITEYKNEYCLKVNKYDYIPKKYVACFIMLFKGKAITNAFRYFIRVVRSTQFYKDSFIEFANTVIQVDERNKIMGISNPDYQGISLTEQNPFSNSLNNGLSIIKQMMSISDINNVTEDEMRELLHLNILDVRSAINSNSNRINCGIDQDLFDYTIAKEYLLNKKYESEKEIAEAFYSLVIFKDLLPLVISNVKEENLEECEKTIRELSLSVNDPRFQIWNLESIRKMDISELFFYLGQNIVTLANVINYFSVDCFDIIPTVINHFIDQLDSKEFDILKRREHETLEEIGITYGFTRERTRQIEASLVSKFDLFYRDNLASNDKNLIFVFPRMSGVFSLNAFSKKLGERNNCFRVLMKSAKLVEQAKYSKTLDAIVESESVISNLSRIIEEVCGDYFKKIGIEDKINECLDLLDDSGFDKDIIMRFINDKYHDCGSFYSKNERLTDLRRIEILLEKHFDNGFHFSDNEHVKELNTYSMEEFGEEMYELSKLDKTNHVIQALIARSKLLILCDSGTYIHISKVNELSIGLMGKIIIYITSKNMPVGYGDILATFKDELSSIGINNKYALQGVMSPYKGELFKSENDYVVPINNNQSMREAMVGWIDKQDGLFTYEDFTKQFKGAASSVFASALYDYKDVAYYWQSGYITLKALQLNEGDVAKLKELLDGVISEYQKGYCSADEIYNVVKAQMPEFLTQKKIVYSYDLFSILQIVFRNDYKFKRPLVGKLDCEFETTAEIIDRYLQLKSVVKLSELIKHLNAKCVAMNEDRTVLKIIEDKRNEFVAIDKDTIVKKDDFAITEREIIKLDVVIEMLLEYQESIDIEKDIVEKNYFNTIANYKVNKWLVFGVVNSYLRDKYELISETPIFKNGSFFIKAK